MGCARLSVGLCTVHDIIVKLRARLYDIKGGSAHSTRHRSRLLWDKTHRYDTMYDKIRCNLIAD